MATRNNTVKIAKSYIGAEKGSKKHKKLVDTFNKKKPHGEVASVRDDWCAISWTAWCLLAGLTDKEAPMSYNCGTLVSDAKKLGIWVEKDEYQNVKVGDGIIYYWSASKGEVDYGASHVGMVVSVSKTKIKVIEGNYSTTDKVAYRTIPRDYQYIRGWITPMYKTKREEKVANAAKKLAWAKGTKKKKYAYKGGKPTSEFKSALEKKYPTHNKWGKAPSKGASCDVFVGVVMRVAGITKYPRGFSEQVTYKSSKYKAHAKKYVSPWSIIKKLGKRGTYVVQYKKAGTKVHTLVYSNGIIYEAGYQKTYGHVNTSLKKLKVKRRYVRVLEFK